MNKKKIINDPVYGFVSIPFDLAFDLMEHPYFQRLRRIQQLGLTHYVYPGALHTRFHHALGAMHLMSQAIKVLRAKGVDISPDEEEAVIMAILMHDIGHGPFSHALEHTLIDLHHEELSLMFMESLNEFFGGKLTTTVAIFKNKYPKKFLHELVSSQLDMDRLDYLNRDSFFTGVSEGVIGYDRIIKMLNVRNDQLVVEEKGIYSVEKFLIARRIMYWQVYLHKTVLSAEKMLIQTLKRIRTLAREGTVFNVSDNLAFFMYGDKGGGIFRDKTAILDNFSRLDDYDIIYALKRLSLHRDFVLSYLCRSLLERNLFKLELKNVPFERDQQEEMRIRTQHYFGLKEEEADFLVIAGTETNKTYSTMNDEIKILLKNGEVKRFSESTDYQVQAGVITKHYLSYPKILQVITH